MNMAEAEKIVKTLKVGQKVKLLKVENSLSIVIDKMKKYMGTTTKIREIGYTAVRVECDNGLYAWSPDMFEIIEDNNKTFNGKKIKRVIFNGDTTIVLFTDGTKAITKRVSEDKDDKEKALAMALVKSVYGKNFFKDLFERYIPKKAEEIVSPDAVESEAIISDEIIVGDWVQVREWDDMVNEFKVDYDGDIDLGDSYFFCENRAYCGNIYKVNDVDDEVFTLSTIDDEYFHKKSLRKVAIQYV